MRWLDQHWMGAGCVLGAGLLVLLPILKFRMSLAELVVLLNLMVYIIHQVEEHTDDRFRLWVNREIAGCPEALSSRAVMIINVGGVWLFCAVSLLAAVFVHVGFGLLASYLCLINGVIHVLGGLAKRAYNPGLWTAIVLLIPVGAWSLRVISPYSTTFHHVFAIVMVVLLHVAIVVHVRNRTKVISLYRGEA